MMGPGLSYLAVAVVAVATAGPAMAESPRELLVRAGFEAKDKPTALSQIDAAISGADSLLARNPRDQEALLQRAIALSYRGKLKRSRADLMAARKALEALIASNPRNAEAQMALGGWHLGAIVEAGPILARTALGARRATGLQALDRAVALGGDRPLFFAFASLIRVQLNAGDMAAGRKLAEAAVAAKPAASIDRIMQRQASVLLKSLRPGNEEAAANTAKLLLPFGRLR